MYPIYLHGLGQTPASWENLIAQFLFIRNPITLYLRGN